MLPKIILRILVQPFLHKINSIWRNSFIKQKIDLYYSLIKQTIRFARKIIAYSRILWTDHDWDYVYILILLQFKLARVRKAIISNNFIVNACKYGHQIRIAELLLQRLIDNDYCATEWKEHEERWGAYDFGGPRGITRTKIVTTKDYEDERKEFSRISKHEKYMRTQDLDYVFKHIRDHLEKWWD